MAENIKKTRIQQLTVVNDDTVYETLHPETDSTIVLYNGEKIFSGTKFTNTKEALDALVADARDKGDALNELLKAGGRLDQIENKISEAGGAIVLVDAAGWENIQGDPHASAEDRYEHNLGTQIFIIDPTVKTDYWISQHLPNFTPYVDGAENNIDPRFNYFSCGWYGISPLDAKTDLSGYQAKEDQSLKTNNKTIVGAINEVKELSSEVISDVENNSNSLRMIVEGVPGSSGLQEYTVVGKANYAATAGTADEAVVAERAIKFEEGAVVRLSGDVTGENTITGGGTTTEIKVSLSKTTVKKGIYSAVNVDEQGRVQAGYQIIEVGSDVNNDPTSSLPIGGIFFRKIS